MLQLTLWCSFLSLTVATISLPIERSGPTTISSGITERWRRSTPLVDARLGNLPYMPYIKVQLGTPPQTVHVQPDTGSSDFVIPAFRCRAFPTDVAFNCNASHTCHEEMCGHGHRVHNCPFEVVYGDGGTIKGVVVTDQVSISVHKTPDLRTKVYIDLIKYAWPHGRFSHRYYNGIFGMGPSRSTGSGRDAPLPLILKEHHFPDVFAIYTGCNIGGESGVLTIGGIDKRAFRGSLQYTPMVRHKCETWDYCAEVTGVQVGHHQVIKSPKELGTVLVDSGTTMTLMPQAPFDDIRNFFQRYYCHLPLVCRPRGHTLFDGKCIIGKAIPEGFPVMRWQFHGDVVVDVPPEAYFVKAHHNLTANAFCWGLAAVPQERGNPDTTLGDTFMAATYIVFDRERRRIGFATPVASPWDHIAGEDDSPQKQIILAFGFTTLVFVAATWMMCQATLPVAHAKKDQDVPQSQRYGAI